MPKPYKNKNPAIRSGKVGRARLFATAPGGATGDPAAPQLRQGLGEVGRVRPGEPRVRQGSQARQSSPVEPSLSTPPLDPYPLPVPPVAPPSPEPSVLAPVAPAPAAAEENPSSEIISSLQAAIQESREDCLRLTTALDQLAQQQTQFDATLAELETRLNNLRNQ